MIYGRDIGFGFGRFSGRPTAFQNFYTHGIVSFFEGDIQKYPHEFSLSKNTPDPFFIKTVIEYSVPEISEVTIKLYNSLGGEEAVLVNNTHLPGCYRFEINGALLPGGVYFYNMEAFQFSETMNMILLK